MIHNVQSRFLLACSFLGLSLVILLCYCFFDYINFQAFRMGLFIAVALAGMSLAIVRRFFNRVRSGVAAMAFYFIGLFSGLIVSSGSIPAMLWHRRDWFVVLQVMFIYVVLVSFVVMLPGRSIEGNNAKSASLRNIIVVSLCVVLALCLGLDFSAIIKGDVSSSLYSAYR